MHGSLAPEEVLQVHAREEELRGGQQEAHQLLQPRILLIGVVPDMAQVLPALAQGVVALRIRVLCKRPNKTDMSIKTKRTNPRLLGRRSGFQD
jgi:hypothetical protein